MSLVVHHGHAIQLTSSIEHEYHILSERLATSQPSHQHDQDPIQFLCVFWMSVILNIGGGA